MVVFCPISHLTFLLSDGYLGLNYLLHRAFVANRHPYQGANPCLFFFPLHYTSALACVPLHCQDEYVLATRQQIGIQHNHFLYSSLLHQVRVKTHLLLGDSVQLNRQTLMQSHFHLFLDSADFTSYVSLTTIVIIL